MTTPPPTNSASADASIHPGSVLADRYVLGPMLARGGMGRVHEAHDRKLEREVAVKLLDSAMPDAESLYRFQREALATGSLQHPNVVAVYDAGEERGRPFIVTELLRGATLRERLRKGPLPLAEALRIARQVAFGLAAAHAKGLTHRDLKPENIFITDEGFVKILDFGLVKLAEHLAPPPDAALPDEARTGAGRALGTVGYMAPEQVRGKPVDPRADLFSLGAVLYEMVAGRRPFTGGSQTEIGYATLFKQPEALPHTVPRAMRDLIDRCLQKNADKRGTCGEALAVLEAIAPEPDAAPEREHFWRRPRFWFVAAGATALASFLVAGLRMRQERVAPLQPPPQAGTVAILPFGARDAPKFAWLSEGVVDLLARDLKGTDLRVVDSASVLRALGGDVSTEVEKVRGASAQLGAKYFVLGRIEERRGELVLEAVLHAGDGVAVSEAAAQGDPAQVLRLVRQLSDQLQRRPLPKAGFDARLEQLARQTSRSTRALQAWLEGERLARRGHGDDLVDAFQHAVAADPEFALAHFRLGVVARLFEPGLAEDSFLRAQRNSDRLSPSERMLLQGYLAVLQGRYADAESAFVEATRKYPDEPQTWMQLAELYFHENPLRARSPIEGADALQHVLVLDPMNTEAMRHLGDLALLRGERAVAAKIADRLRALVDDPVLLVDSGLMLAWARGDSGERDRVIADLLKPGAARSVLNAAFVRAEWMADHGTVERIAAQMAASEVAEDRAQASYLRGIDDLSRGRPDAAGAEMLRAAQLDLAGPGAYRAVWIDSLDFLPRTKAQLAAALASAERLDVTRSAFLAPQKEALIGDLALRAGNAAAAEAAAAALERMPPLEGSSITSDLALALRARLLAKRNDAAGALALLEQQRLRIPARYVPWYSDLAEAPLRAELLAAVGRPRDGLQVLDAVNLYRGIPAAWAAPAHLAKAQILDSLGDRGAAIDQYAAFSELWKDCETAERPAVERALARSEELRRLDRRAFR